MLARGSELLSRGYAYFFQSAVADDGVFRMPEAEFSSLNPRHKQFIQKHISEFDQDFSALVSAHRTHDSLQAVIIVLNFMDYLGPMLTIGAATGIYFFIDKSTQSNAKMMQFQQSLANLKQIYNWCAQAGPEVTSHEVFLELSSRVMPLVQTKELVIWQPEQMSASYKKQLMLPPHHQHFADMQLVSPRGADWLQQLPWLQGVKQYLPDLVATERMLTNIRAEVTAWRYGLDENKANKNNMT